MDADRLLADEQALPDLAVGAALRDERRAPRARGRSARRCPVGGAVAGGSPAIARTRSDRPFGAIASSADRDRGRPPASRHSAGASRPRAPRRPRRQVDPRPAGELAQLAQQRPRLRAQRRARRPRAAAPGHAARPDVRRPRPGWPRPGASGPGRRRTGPRGRPSHSATRPQTAGVVVALQPPLEGARRRQVGLGDPSRPGRRRGPAGLDERRRRGRAPAAVRSRAAASGASWRRSRASAAAARVDLGDHRGHPGGEDPLLGVADDGPAALDRPARVGDVAAPQRERGGGQVVRPGQLRLAHGVELEHRLAQQPRRVSPASVSISTMASWRTAVRKTTPTGSQLSARSLSARASAQRPRRNSDSATLPGQEVAVDGLETGAPGVLDPVGRRPRPPRSGGRRGRAPSSGWLGSGRARRGRRARGPPRSASRSSSIARRRVAAPGERHRQRRRGVDLLVARRPGRTRGRP